MCLVTERGGICVMYEVVRRCVVGLRRVGGRRGGDVKACGWIKKVGGR